MGEEGQSLLQQSTEAGKALSKSHIIGFARVSKTGKSVGIRMVEPINKGDYINISLQKLQEMMSMTPEAREQGNVYVRVIKFDK